MAMKRKPKDSDISVDLTSGVTAPMLAGYQHTRLSDVIKGALRKPSRSLENRCKPFETRNKKLQVKWKKRKKIVDSVSSNLAKTIPVLDLDDGPQSIADDAERHALWWDFNGDRSTLMKTLPINMPAKEKAERLRSIRMSQESKARINNVKACGITPRSHKKLPKIISPHVPHHASSEFGEVVADNPEYMQEMYERYLVNLSIGKLASLDMELCFTPERTGVPVTHHDVNPIDYTDVNAEETIRKLEALVEEDKQDTVSPVTALDNFDISSALPSDTAVPTLVQRETQYEQEQWGMNWPIDPNVTFSIEEWTPDHEDMYKTMVAYRRQYRGTQAAKSLVACKRSATKRREDGFAYQHWLIKHRSSLHLRERVELSKWRVNPEHDLNLGITVHPMYHNGMEHFANLRNYYTPRRIAMFSMGEADRKCFGHWYELTEQLMIEKEEARADASLDGATIIEQAEKEQLTEKIVDDAVHKLNGETQLSFKQWNYMIASQYDKMTVQPKVTTVSEDSPSANTAEVVSLKDVREKRAANISTFLSGLDFNISDLTPEQKSVVRNTIIEAVDRALGA